jgi:hypothetical protein
MEFLFNFRLIDLRKSFHFLIYLNFIRDIYFLDKNIIWIVVKIFVQFVLIICCLFPQNIT